ncbi:hypothetical protein BKG79_17215 [Mycobacteroides chelonae]|uniref:hypothetical protein n=1 Tax=Mycobacteroides chelonae TaxID=1774 RepID=UPI0008A90CA4|nr:hypothetical protein [Mycobacteroides chelonae]OHU37321.1 hypothetical protein BKG79_17215 [Mycobacteroides chelonae]
MSDIVFMDTETLGLDIDAPIWEFAAIRRNGETGKDDARMHLFINHDPASWLSDLPEQFATDYRRRFTKARLLSRITPAENAADLISAFLTGRPHIVGAVPSFDTQRISRQLLRPAGIPDPWHYHLIDVENVVAGYLAGRGELFTPPWKSDQLSAAVGVDPEMFDRHTAMGDVLWTRAQWDAVIGQCGNVAGSHEVTP